MTTWFTADTHLGHTNIIRYCNRPFASAFEMDAMLIANWNAVVRPDDTVWHLRDFVYRNNKNAASYLHSLNGFKHLVHGNHDNFDIRTSSGWMSSQTMAEVKVDGTKIMLLHYAMRVWPGSYHGALHLYGHSHGSLPVTDSPAMSADCWDFRPVRLEEIRKRLEKLPRRRGRRGEAT